MVGARSQSDSSLYEKILIGVDMQTGEATMKAKEAVKAAIEFRIARAEQIIKQSILDKIKSAASAGRFYTELYISVPEGTEDETPEELEYLEEITDILTNKYGYTLQTSSGNNGPFDHMTLTIRWPRRVEYL